MPYALRQTENGWGVQNTESGDWKSKDTSKENAEAQLRLLEGVERHTINKKTGRTYSQAKR